MDRNNNNFDLYTYNSLEQWFPKCAQSQEIRGLFPGYQWILFCNSYIEVYVVLNQINNIFFK
jgi:hypothetical protein